MVCTRFIWDSQHLSIRARHSALRPGRAARAGLKPPKGLVPPGRSATWKLACWTIIWLYLWISTWKESHLTTTLSVGRNCVEKWIWVYPCIFNECQRPKTVATQLKCHLMQLFGSAGYLCQYRYLVGFAARKPGLYLCEAFWSRMGISTNTNTQIAVLISNPVPIGVHWCFKYSYAFWSRMDITNSNCGSSQGFYYQNTLLN
jgi:hypothetical protein